MIGDELSLDSALRLLSHTHRRALVDCLVEHDEPIALADAAADVAAMGTADSGHNLATEDVERAYVALYHVHVPKLTDEDIVAYDRNQKTVRLTDRGRQLATVLRSLSEEPDRPAIT